MEGMVKMITEQRQQNVEFWRGRRVFVTGATGIVGSWLVKELLSNNSYVVALIRDADPQSELYRSGDIQRVSVINGCLEEFSELERAINTHDIDTVFHLAAQPLVGVAYRYPLQTFESNIRGSYNLLEACRVHEHFVKRIVIASSDKAYGTQKQLPYTEDLSLQGEYPYDVSKSCTDLISQCYYYTYGMPVAIARCGNIYGGGDLNWSRIVPETIRACLRTEAPVIRSDGKYTRDYMYVKDVISGYLRLAECMEDPNIKGQAFNFSPERASTVLEIVEVIQRLMGCENIRPRILNTAKAEIYSQYLSSEKAHQLLNWHPQYTLEQGLLETIGWYREYLAR